MNEDYQQGYMQALSDLLDDECTSPVIAEAREWMDKKERHANS